MMFLQLNAKQQLLIIIHAFFWLTKYVEKHGNNCNYFYRNLVPYLNKKLGVIHSKKLDLNNREYMSENKRFFNTPDS